MRRGSRCPARRRQRRPPAPATGATGGGAATTARWHRRRGRRVRGRSVQLPAWKVDRPAPPSSPSSTRVTTGGTGGRPWKRDVEHREVHELARPHVLERSAHELELRDQHGLSPWSALDARGAQSRRTRGRSAVSVRVGVLLALVRGPRCPGGWEESRWGAAPRGRLRRRQAQARRMHSRRRMRKRRRRRRRGRRRMGGRGRKRDGRCGGDCGGGGLGARRGGWCCLGSRVLRFGQDGRGSARAEDECLGLVDLFRGGDRGLGVAAGAGLGGGGGLRRCGGRDRRRGSPGALVPARRRSLARESWREGREHGVVRGALHRSSGGASSGRLRKSHRRAARSKNPSWGRCRHGWRARPGGLSATDSDSTQYACFSAFPTELTSTNQRMDPSLRAKPYSERRGRAAIYSARSPSAGRRRAA